jgi:uncharacterized phage protein (TIGR02220 family)
MRQEAFEIRDIRKKEQFVVDDAYLNGYAKVCGIYATGVYVTLCRHADLSNQTCFPSIPLITRKLSISRRQVIRALQVLEDWNIIRRERTEGRKNRYWLIDKKHWKRTSAPQSPVTDRHQCHTDTGAYQSPTSARETPVPVPDRHPKDSHIRIHNKEKNIYPLPHEFGDIPYEEIVSCLNEKTGSSYRHERPKTRRLIKARWREGFRLEDFRKVIENMAASWGRNPEMQNYLRPETLFSNKFESYLNWRKGGNNGNYRAESAQYGKPSKYAGIGEVLEYEV